jgi:hypothetical protein
MGFALGLVVLFELGAIPIPFNAGAGPIERAAIAVGIAVAGALIGYLFQLLFVRAVEESEDADDDAADGS